MLCDLADPAAYRCEQRRADRVADLFAFAVGEEVLAAEALVGTQKQPGAGGQSAQALVQKRVAPLEAPPWPLRSFARSHSPVSPTKRPFVGWGLVLAERVW